MNKLSLYRSLFPLLLAAGSLYLLSALDELPVPRFEPMGPALFPQIILGCFICLCVVDTVAALFRLHRAPTTPQACHPEPCETLAQRVRPLVCLLGFLFYLWLLDTTELPYIPMTFLFIALGCWYLGHFTLRALWLSVAASLGVTGIIYGIFGVVLQTFFP